MIDKITTQDINQSIIFLRLGSNFTKTELKNRLVKFSKIYHPQGYKANIEIFKKLVFSYELLSYYRKRIKSSNLEIIIDDINKHQLDIIDKKIKEYSEISLKKFLRRVNKDPLVLRVFKILLYSVMGLATLIMLLTFLIEAFSGHLNFFGVIFFGALIFGIIIRVFSGNNNYIERLDYRMYLTKKKK